MILEGWLFGIAWLMFGGGIFGFRRWKLYFYARGRELESFGII